MLDQMPDILEVLFILFILCMTVLSIVWATLPERAIIGVDPHLKSAALSDKLDALPFITTFLTANRLEDREFAASSIRRLLAQITPNDGFLLGEAANKGLCKVLTLPYVESNAGLVRSVLHAITLAGDEQALFRLEPLANQRGRTREEENLLIKARKCLAVLRTRVDANISRMILVRAADIPADTLLRPTDPSHQTPESLLRPASFAPGRDPKSLLRPAPPHLTEEASDSSHPTT